MTTLITLLALLLLATPALADSYADLGPVVAAPGEIVAAGQLGGPKGAAATAIHVHAVLTVAGHGLRGWWGLFRVVDGQVATPVELRYLPDPGPTGYQSSDVALLALDEAPAAGVEYALLLGLGGGPDGWAALSIVRMVSARVR